MGHFIISVLGIYMWMFMENPIGFLTEIFNTAPLMPMVDDVVFNFINIVETFLSGFT